MTTLGTESTPLRVAIVGSGPSGMYAVDALVKSEHHVIIDMFDRLPTPFGLLRGGVAPDHQRMKSVGKAYDRIALKSDAFSFYGNVKIGEDISVETLKDYYDAIIFACGAETDKKLGIPGEDLPGSHTATEFVGWYNGHPDYQDRTFDLSQKTAVIIGQGNVAIDVTRILAKTANELKASDITQNALDALSKSNITDIHLIGRRGPVQAKFTQLEIKEMGELEDAEPVVNPEDFNLSPSCQAELDDPSNNKAQKNMAILEHFKTLESQNKSKRVHIHFFKSPLEINGSSHVEALELGINELIGEPGKQQAKSTDKTETLPCGLIFRSVGYRGIEMPGIPFDEKRGVFPNEDGRLIDNGSPQYGLYAVGWIKRGPSGVLGSNKACSTKTVEILLSDLAKITACSKRSSEALLEDLKSKGIQLVSFDDWQRIDAQEIAAGEKVGKPREKFTSVDALLKAAKGERVS